MWEKVPQAVNLNTWPATIFVGRDGKVKLRIEPQFPLAQAAEAHKALEGRKTTGKILLIP